MTLKFNFFIRKTKNQFILKFQIVLFGSGQQPKQRLLEPQFTVGHTTLSQLRDNMIYYLKHE